MGLFSFFSGRDRQSDRPVPTPKSKENPYRNEPWRALEDSNGLIEAFDNGGVGYTSRLRDTAAEIANKLYPKCSLPYLDEAAQKLYTDECERIDRIIWIPLAGKPLLGVVKESLNAEGIHNYAPEVLQRNAENFAVRIQRGDIDNLTSLLFYRLKIDVQFVSKLQAIISVAEFNYERFFASKLDMRPDGPRVLIHERRPPPNKF